MAVAPAAILFLSLLMHNAYAHPTIYDITKYGAKPGVDISKALLNAWNDASNSTTPSKIVIPQGQWYLKQVRLENNKAPLELEIKGTIKADAELNQLPNNKAEWITINYVDNFTLSGGGLLDGLGLKAWQQNDCHKRKCAKTPLNLSFNFIKNSIISDLTSKDSKNWHMNLISSQNVTINRLTITAPGNSPNTDGIHIARCSNIKVLNSKIGTGDDCISIGDEMSNLHIENVVCGPGHGISIGSLGKSITEKDVKGVTVKNCTFIGTTNGVRVKTWPSEPATLTISDLRFEDLVMNNVSTPVILDQNYCPHNLCDPSKPSLIKITNVSINNIWGTTWTRENLVFNCSSAKPCDVKVGTVDLKYGGIHPDGFFTNNCTHVYPMYRGKQTPIVCSNISPHKSA